MSSEKPIIKKRIEQKINSIKEKLEFIFCNSKYSLFIKKTINIVKIHPKIIANPPILTIGVLWVFLKSGKSKRLKFKPNFLTIGTKK